MAEMVWLTRSVGLLSIYPFCHQLPRTPVIKPISNLYLYVKILYGAARQFMDTDSRPIFAIIMITR